MKKQVVVALDLGTSSVRAALFDLRGQRVADSLEQRTYPLVTDTNGRAELDPGTLLAEAKACLAGLGEAGATAVGAGVSCFWHSLLGTDAKGNALTPVYTWADSRCREDAAVLRRMLDEEVVHEQTGCMLRSSFWPAKLRWLKRTQKGLFRKVKYWVSPAEWIQWQLTGVGRCGLGMATGTGLLNRHSMEWDPEMLAVCGITPRQLLPLNDEPVKHGATLWFPATGDGAASNLGSACTDPTRGAINVGTSAALRIMRPPRQSKVPVGVFAYRIGVNRLLVGGAVSNAGNLRAWCLRELNLPTDAAAIEKAMEGRKLPVPGLDVLPFWTAERAPYWNEESRGMICGMQQSTTALDLLQAITEGFYLRMRLIADMVDPKHRAAWVVSGGILKSRDAVQRLANVMGRPIHASREPEASLRGAAVLALEGLKVKVPDLEPGREVKPDKAVTKAYTEALERQQRLEKAGLS